MECLISTLRPWDCMGSIRVIQSSSVPWYCGLPCYIIMLIISTYIIKLVRLNTTTDTISMLLQKLTLLMVRNIVSSPSLSPKTFLFLHWYLLPWQILSSSNLIKTLRFFMPASFLKFGHKTDCWRNSLVISFHPNSSCLSTIHCHLVFYLFTILVQISIFSV